MSILIPKNITLPLQIGLISWGGSGYLRPASGTWGTLVALPFAFLLHFYGGIWALFIAAGILYLLAVPCIRSYERATGSHDSSRIVIDEVVGILIALCAAYLTWIDYIAAFFLFRAFDAIKPGPIGWVDQRIPGAHGVLLDDVVAGIFTALCLIFIHGIAGV